MTDRPGEFELIARYFAPLAKDKGAANLTDDVATLRIAPGNELVVTTDTLISGVHFLGGDPPDLVARKALRVNLSDLAAKGAAPIGYFLALSLPADWREDWVSAFAHGLAEDQNVFSVGLLGGDTTATPGPVTITITALGRAPDNKTIRRGGAKLGDLVFVTGTIGDAGGGLAILKGEGGSLSPAEREALVSRYRLPEPRLAFGQMLIGLANSSLDVSDGLFADLGHIADASRARIVFAADKIPLSDALKKLWGNDALLRAAACGDDYEIAFTAPPDKRNMVLAAAKTSGLPLSEIGRVETGEGIILRDEGGTPLPVSRAGYKHF